MNRALRVVGIFAFIGVLVVALWTARTRPARRSNQESLKDIMHSAITNPTAFAKNRFTGGIGAALTTDPATGALRIVNVIAGSPAEMAGLRDGDHILQVDGVATSGRTLAQNVESIRGFAAVSVTLTVQRTGSTNLECVIHRSSWKSLGVPR
jgi:C-terminal processing protease CtpA/Prc